MACSGVTACSAVSVVRPAPERVSISGYILRIIASLLPEESRPLSEVRGDKVCVERDWFRVTHFGVIVRMVEYALGKSPELFAPHVRYVPDTEDWFVDRTLLYHLKLWAENHVTSACLLYARQ